jgi:hypothetical protein
MLPDDAFRRAFDEAVIDLAAWAGSYRDVASVDCETSSNAVRLSLKPHTATACALEFMLHRDSQSYDVQFAQGDTWEGLPVAGEPRALLPLLQAVADGRILTRALISAATGAYRDSGVIVSPTAGASRTYGLSDHHDEALLVKDRHWAPYRRS